MNLERGHKQSQAFGKSMFLYLKSYLNETVLTPNA